MAGIVRHRLPLNALEKAVYLRLTGDITAFPVFAVVPQNQAEPYIELGELRGIDQSTKTSREHRITQTIMAWSSERSKKQINDILNDILEALSRADLGMDDDFRLARFSGLSSYAVFGPVYIDGTLIHHGEVRILWSVEDTQT